MSDTRPAHPDVEIVEATQAFERFLRVDVFRFRHRLFSGEWSGVRNYDVLRRKQAASVVLYDPDRESVVLVEQFRLPALNRKALPDSWETGVIEKRFLDPAWPAGKPFSAEVETKGRPAFRVMVPEYYVESCLACHGSPKGQMDITGYPKEGGKLNDLGAAISITLYH